MPYQAYQLPPPPHVLDIFESNPTSYLAFPIWLRDAVATKDVRLTADGEDVYVRTPAGEMLVEPTDYIIKSGRGNFFVVSEALFASLTAGDSVLLPPEPSPEPPPLEPVPESTPFPSPRPDFPDPPYSPGVLARSAEARRRQAEWEASAPTPQAPAPQAPAPQAPVDEPAIEGADSNDPGRGS
jgi:hypothetical protein